MNKRIGTLFLASTFLFATSVATAQLIRKPKISLKKKETKKAESASATSSQTMKAITWKDNGISFEVPSNWDQGMLEREMASFMLSGTSEGVSLSANISRLGSDFPAGESLKAYREAGQKGKKDGKLSEAKDFKIGDIDGLLTVEAPKDAANDHRRLIWIGYQKKGGWNMVNIMLSSYSGAFSKHEETFRKVLGTFKIQPE